MGCDVPSFLKDQEICKGYTRGLGLGSQHAEDGRIDVVHRDAANVHEFLQSVLVGNVAVACLKKEGSDLMNDRLRLTFHAKRRHRMGYGLVCTSGTVRQPYHT